MKKYLFLLAAILFIAASTSCFAQSIQTGNASANSTIINNVSGTGSVYTKIEVEANGEKKTLETTEQGAHSLEVNSNKNNIKASSSAEVKQIIKTQKTRSISLIDNLKNLIRNLFKNLSF
jgi:hypothetical protein